MKVSINLIMRFIEDLFILKYLTNRPLKPLLLAYFITFRCNLRCYYCEYAENSDFRTYPELNTEGAIQLLRIARQGIPSIAFSGGEPLVREDINIVVKASRMKPFILALLWTIDGINSIWFAVLARCL